MFLVLGVLGNLATCIVILRNECVDMLLILCRYI